MWGDDYRINIQRASEIWPSSDIQYWVKRLQKEQTNYKSLSEVISKCNENKSEGITHQRMFKGSRAVRITWVTKVKDLDEYSFGSVYRSHNTLYIYL